MKKKHGLFAVVIVATVSASCAEMCGNESMAEFLSPGSEGKMVVFTRNCGATTGFSTQASVLPADQQLPNEGGNMLVLEGIVELKASWQSENQVTVLGLGAAKAFKRESKIGHVNVAYGE